MKCGNCGQTLTEGVKFCGSCGTPVTVAPSPVPSPPISMGSASPLAASPLAHGAPVAPSAQVAGFPQSIPPHNAAMPGPANPFAGQLSNKSYMTTFLLSFFLGWLGADRFYTGQAGLGVLKLITLGGCGLWSFIDTILILSGTRKDKFGRALYGRDKDFKTTLIIFLVFTALGTIGSGVQGFMSGWKDASEVIKSTTTDSSQTVKSAVEPRPVGSKFDVVNYDDQKLAVTLVKVVTDPQPLANIDKPLAGKRLIAVQFKVQNTGDKTISEYAETSALLQDSADQSYETDVNQVKDCQAFVVSALDKLAPGESALGCVVFQIPTSVKATKAKYIPSDGASADMGVWNLQ